MQGEDSLYDEIPSISSAANKHSFDSRWTTSFEEIAFSGKREDCCICFIDMVGSTKTTSQLTPEKIGKYYSIFLNSTAIIAKNFGATIVKNTGDCLIYYFPRTAEPVAGNQLAFKEVIECGMTMIEARGIINAKLHEERLPSLNYRISAEYGTVEFAKSASSNAQDLFGPAMNICAKINSRANPNGMVIGSNLYQIVKSFDDYNFEKMAENSITSDNIQYVIYAITSKQKKSMINPFARISEIIPIQRVPSIIDNGNNTESRIYGGGVKDPPTKTNKVLLVDDEKDVLFTYKMILESKGHSVDAFTDPYAALQQFDKESNYDLLITDIKMPNLNGLELYNKIKAKDNNIKVLFISALEASEMLVSVLPGLAAKNIIRKPVEREKFIATIESLID